MWYLFGHVFHVVRVHLQCSYVYYHIYYLCLDSVYIWQDIIHQRITFYEILKMASRPHVFFKYP